MTVESSISDICSILEHHVMGQFPAQNIKVCYSSYNHLSGSFPILVVTYANQLCYVIFMTKVIKSCS